jgi:hypothetical protein
LRWVSDNPQGCISLGATFDWAARCQNNNGLGISPNSGNAAYSGYPNPGTFQLEPYTRNTSAFVIAYGTENGKKLITGYTVGSSGSLLAVTIESPDGTRWASNWFAIP